jgi:rod shape determining protein RodA
MISFFSKLKSFDIPLAITSGLLILVGLALLYATSLSNNTMSVFYRQLTFSVVGAVAYVFFALYNYQNLAKSNRWVYIILIVLLGGLLIWGRAVRGSTRWIDVGFFNFQPAEFAKIVVILGLSRWMYLRRGQINSWKNLLITLVYTCVPAVLILLEPDLGSSLILFSIWFGIILISPINKRFVVLLLLGMLVFSGVAWKFFLKDYQRQRIEIFLDPSLDPRGRGYNVRQAIIAVGSGELGGRGLGQGLQSQLKFLPERQTDFIFASSAEEIGFFGCIALLALYAYLLWRLVKVMSLARDDLAVYITGGVLFLLLPQIIINIGMNIGLLPVTGIPLPFLSYGGSSLLVVLISLGIVQNIVRQSQNLRF